MVTDWWNTKLKFRLDYDNPRCSTCDSVVSMSFIIGIQCPQCGPIAAGTVYVNRIEIDGTKRR